MGVILYIKESIQAYEMKLEREVNCDEDMRKYLVKLNWNNMLRNKTAFEWWNILKYEIERTIDQFVPLKKQGKRSRNKHLQVKRSYQKNSVQANYVNGL